MAVGTFDFNLGQGGAVDVSISMNVNAGMTVLAEKATFRIAHTAVMGVVMQVGGKLDILFSVFCGSWISMGIKWSGICRFHQPLERDPDPFALIVAGDTGLSRNTAGLSISLDLMAFDVTGLSR